ncbi:MAG: translation initiation factor IF-2 N-terminal domain-containing protein, partial [Schwartzia sp.]|nr:translation initiation factor IF-2 N-terminal domain-containing protein [Schwartzia sp. (in: firmicutes)]
MSKYRVYELAKEFHTESKNVLKLLTQNGYEVKNTLSSVGDEERDLIKKLLAKGKPEEKGAPATKQGAEPPVKEEQPRQAQ